MKTAKVTAGRGISWIKSGIGFVTDRPVVWIGGTAATIGLSIVLNFIPLLGQILSQILSFGMGIFFLSYAQKQKNKVEFDLDVTWNQVKGRLPRLILLMLLSSALAFACVLLVVGTLAVVGGLQYASQGRFPSTLPTGSLIALGISGLIAVIGFYYIMAATSFTTPLILLQNLSIRQALGLSLQAVTRNVGPLFVYFLLLALFMLICIIPFGLGLLLGFPAITASFYVAYEELLGRPDTL
ncbi:MAG TPA: BPSS1780 family membrane protein [Oligoflexus sp.]|uniref:BPSS1780 family membrane protein n=1 Tax=Oligoflexus sp. TaxID=1971216 RepID=UPI002D57F1E9|nr:BPSS1780 family membrane protein [Oligoflexus sp.]HYX33009.1 BPSS1780 family membrane protein [Oligoflexus sp.]